MAAVLEGAIDDVVNALDVLVLERKRLEDDLELGFTTTGLSVGRSIGDSSWRRAGGRSRWGALLAFSGTAIGAGAVLVVGITVGVRVEARGRGG